MLLRPDGLKEKALRALVQESSLCRTGDRIQNAARPPVYLWSNAARCALAFGEPTPGVYRGGLQGHFTEETAERYHPRDAHGRPPSYRIIKMVAGPRIQGAGPQMQEFVIIRANTRKQREPYPPPL